MAHQYCALVFEVDKGLQNIVTVLKKFLEGKDIECVHRHFKRCEL